MVDGESRYTVTYQPENNDGAVTLVDPSFSCPNIQRTVRSCLGINKGRDYPPRSFHSPDGNKGYYMGIFANEDPGTGPN